MARALRSSPEDPPDPESTSGRASGAVRPLKRHVVTVDELRRWCLENGRVVLPVDRVREDTAAAILDRSPETLRHWRSNERPLPFTLIRGRATYHLADLADLINAEPAE